MNRVAFFVDGFNLYHSLAGHKEYNKYKWLDLSKLAQCFVRKNESIADIFYFTAYNTWDREKARRHRVFVQAQRLKAAKVIFGKFKEVSRKCRKCHEWYKTFEEKQTDVNLAIMLLTQAVQDNYDTAVIISSDSDLIPAIEGVKALYPAKRIGVLIPIGRSAEDLKNTCDFHMRMKKRHLEGSLLPERIDLGGNEWLVRPEEWC